MFEINKYKTDSDLELNGVWVDFISGAKIKVASLDNSQYVQRLLQARKDRTLNLDDEVVSIEARRALAEIYVDTILLDWEGFSENGELLPYGKDKALDALLSVKPLFAAVTKAANDEALYRQQLTADIEKN